jgi:hypothetical protein
MSPICRCSFRLSFPLILLLALFMAGTAHAEYLGNVTFDQPSHSFLPNGIQVNVSIDYKIDDPAGRRIYVKPYTNGSPTIGYAVQGSVVYPQGTGTATSYFTITTGNPVVVDEVRIYSRDPDFTETPLEIFVPVFYRFGPNGVYNIETNRSQYSRLPHDMDLNITFEYTAAAPACRIYARPFTNGFLTPGYSASGSADLPPSGAYDQHFSFGTDADITDIRFQIVTLDNTLLDEFFVPFDCHWREWGVYDISFNHDSVTSLHNSQDLVGSFIFDHQETGDFYVWIWCIQDGNYCPDSFYQGSVVEPAGPHPVTRYTRVGNGATQTVDAVRVIVGTPSEVYMEFDIPMLIDYGPHALQNFDFTPASPAIMSYGEHLDMTFDYLTDEGAGVRIFGRADYLHNALFGMTGAGSPLYPAPSGQGDFWMTYNSNQIADSIRFQMVSSDQSELYMEWFQPGYFIWGASGSVSEVTDTPTAVATLGLCFPNPFNPTATIPVNLGRDTHVRLTVYDVRGRLVRTLQDGSMSAGNHVFTFRGDGLSSGAYICRLETPAGVETQRLTLIK